MRNALYLAVVAATALTISACSNHEQSLQRLDGFYVGESVSESSLPDAYVLFDPQCAYCAAQWRNFEPLQRQVIVKWIPVAVLNERSGPQAAMLLESDDAGELMSLHHGKLPWPDTESTEAIEVSAQGRASVRRNNAVLDNLGTQSVPTIVYRDRTSGKLVVTSGVMSTGELARVLGAGIVPEEGE